MIRLDNVKAVYAGHLYSLKHNAEMKNGNVCHVGNLVTGEREVRAVEVPTTASITTKSLVVVASPEIMYDESTRAMRRLDAFSIPANAVATGYELVADDIVSFSTDLVDKISTDAVVGNYVVGQNASVKLKEVATLAGTEKFVGRIESIETIGTTVLVGSAGTIGNITKLIVVRVIKN